jgi:replicative DNA helicase
MSEEPFVAEDLSEEESRELDALTNPDAKKTEHYRWDENFQREIIGLLLNDRWFVSQCRDLVSPEYFTDERHRTVCRILFLHMDVYRAIPTKTLVLEEVRKATANRDNRIQFEYVAEVELIYKKFVPGLETREYLLDKILNFAKLMSMKAAFDKSIALVKKDPESEETWTTIREELRKALIVERNFEEGLNYFETFEERYERMAKEEESRERFTSGFAAIDDALLGGGCHRGEIYSWIGLSGSGKSLALVGAALQNVLQLGKKVLYISLEMGEDAIAERFDAQLANVNINQLRPMKDRVRKAFEGFSTDKEDKRMLVIKQFPAGSMSVSSLKAYMQQLQMFGFTPDLLVIDYIGSCCM